MNISNLAVQIHKLSETSLWDGADMALEMGVSDQRQAQMESVNLLAEAMDVAEAMQKEVVR